MRTAADVFFRRSTPRTSWSSSSWRILCAELAALGQRAGLEGSCRASTVSRAVRRSRRRRSSKCLPVVAVDKAQGMDEGDDGSGARVGRKACRIVGNEKE